MAKGHMNGGGNGHSIKEKIHAKKTKARVAKDIGRAHAAKQRLIGRKIDNAQRKLINYKTKILRGINEALTTNKISQRDGVILKLVANEWHIKQVTAELKNNKIDIACLSPEQKETLGIFSQRQLKSMLEDILLDKESKNSRNALQLKSAIEKWRKIIPELAKGKPL